MNENRGRWLLKIDHETHGAAAFLILNEKKGSDVLDAYCVTNLSEKRKNKLTPTTADLHNAETVTYTTEQMVEILNGRVSEMRTFANTHPYLTKIRNNNTYSMKNHAREQLNETTELETLMRRYVNTYNQIAKIGSHNFDKLDTIQQLTKGLSRLTRRVRYFYGEYADKIIKIALENAWYTETFGNLDNYNSYILEMSRSTSKMIEDIESHGKVAEVYKISDHNGVIVYEDKDGNVAIHLVCGINPVSNKIVVETLPDHKYEELRDIPDEVTSIEDAAEKMYQIVLEKMSRYTTVMHDKKKTDAMLKDLQNIFESFEYMSVNMDKDVYAHAVSDIDSEINKKLEALRSIIHGMENDMDDSNINKDDDITQAFLCGAKMQLNFLLEVKNMIN